MYDLERFSRLLARDFVPLLRAQGFEASGSVFRRVTGDRIDVVCIQGSRRRRQCRVILGVHYTSLPPAGRPAGILALNGRFRHHDCAFRECLHEQGETDRWWSYGTDDATAAASAASLAETFARCAEPFFSQFEPSPESPAKTLRK